MMNLVFDLPKQKNPVIAAFLERVRHALPMDAVEIDCERLEVLFAGTWITPRVPGALFFMCGDGMFTMVICRFRGAQIVVHVPWRYDGVLDPDSKMKSSLGIPQSLWHEPIGFED